MAKPAVPPGTAGLQAKATCRGLSGFGEAAPAAHAVFGQGGKLAQALAGPDALGQVLPVLFRQGADHDDGGLIHGGNVRGSQDARSGQAGPAALVPAQPQSADMRRSTLMQAWRPLTRLAMALTPSSMASTHHPPLDRRLKLFPDPPGSASPCLWALPRAPEARPMAMILRLQPQPPTAWPWKLVTGQDKQGTAARQAFADGRLLQVEALVHGQGDAAFGVHDAGGHAPALGLKGRLPSLV